MTYTPHQKDKSDDEISALDTLLEAERAALLKGDLAALTEMLPDKEALIEGIQAQTHRDLPLLKKLQSKVHRNQLLLDSALKGIREVTGRMTTLRRMRGGLETYGSDGTRKHIQVQVDHAIERRS